MKFTPDNIEELEKNQIFVFGSNANGNHAGGAASLAVNKFGAIEGQAEGLQGSSYGFVTLDKRMKRVSEGTFRAQFRKLFKCARENPSKEFLVTKIGCGIAGFEEERVKKYFNQKRVPANVIMPLGWLPVRGYKAFDLDMRCRGFQYEAGKVYSHKGKAELCRSGFHFCINGPDVYKYYDYENCVVCEVEATGEVVVGGDKCVTNQIRITRILSSEERKFNSGNGNSGNGNSGDRNSGDRNSGNRNSGNRNSGDRNSGNRNSGNMNSGNGNSGDRNSGNMNSGDRNSGNGNSGNWNSGNWNSGDWNSGYMNTTEPTVRMFDRDTGMTFAEVDLLIPDFFRFDLNQWIEKSDMTSGEVADHPESAVTGGYLKTLDYYQAWRVSWDKASDDDRRKTLQLPNFNADIFEVITGIDIRAELGLS